MQAHAFEISSSIAPGFLQGRNVGSGASRMSGFELSLLCGIFSHVGGSFNFDGEIPALSVEWVQKHII